MPILKTVAEESTTILSLRPVMAPGAAGAQLSPNFKRARTAPQNTVGYSSVVG